MYMHTPCHIYAANLSLTCSKLRINAPSMLHIRISEPHISSIHSDNAFSIYTACVPNTSGKYIHVYIYTRTYIYVYIYIYTYIYI